MHDGVIQQIDTPKRIYQRPANIFVSTFIGLSNVLKAVCAAARWTLATAIRWRACTLPPKAMTRATCWWPCARGVCDRRRIRPGHPRHGQVQRVPGRKPALLPGGPPGQRAGGYRPVRPERDHPGRNAGALQVVKEKINIFDCLQPGHPLFARGYEHGCRKHASIWTFFTLLILAIFLIFVSILSS